MIGYVAFGPVYLCVVLLPNCEGCGAPLVTMGEDGELVDRREQGVCEDCELPERAWSARERNSLKKKRIVVDPYGQPEKERVQ